MTAAAARYSALFAGEARELLRAAEGALDAIARAAANGVEAGDAVDAAFRALHSLKGMAGTLALGDVESLAHALESVLHRTRDGALALTPDVADALVDGRDALERAVEASLDGRATDAADVVERLAPFAATASSDAPTLDTERLVARADAPVVHVTLDPATTLPAARAAIVVARLRALGAVESVCPSIEQLVGSTFAVRVRTSCDDERLTAAAIAAGDVTRVRLERVAPTDAPRRAERSSADRAWRRESHVRVARERLDALVDVSAELTVLRARLAAAARTSVDPRLAAVAGDVVRLLGTLHDEVRDARTAPARDVFERLPRVVRDLARETGKRAELTIKGGSVALDRGLLEELAESLVHLLRNAVDHGVETPDARRAAGKDPVGRIVVRAARERDAVTISVSDDGAGIDRERIAAGAGLGGTSLDDGALLDLVARPGFTTRAAVGRLSGRGVGVDAVRDRVRRLGGALTLSTTRGEGTRFTLRLPLTLAVTRALVVRLGDGRFALPLTHIVETVPFIASDGGAGATLYVRGEALPVVRLADVLGGAASDDAGADAIVVDGPAGRVALRVDAIDGQDALLLKPLPALRGAFRIFGGASILADGTPALVLDVPALLTLALA